MSGESGAQLDRLAALDGATFRLAALAARRFPEGEALDAYVDGDAGLADFLRCGEPGCPWGVAPGSEYCESHKVDRQRAQQRAYKARQGEPEPRQPDCCGNPPPWPTRKRDNPGDPLQADARAYEATVHSQCYGWPQAGALTQLGAPSKPTAKRCGQHKDAHDTGRGYEVAWRSGARGQRRVGRLYEVLGQDGGDSCGRGWDAAGPLPATDRGPDEGQTKARSRRLAYPDPWVTEEARRWFAGHAGWVNHPLAETAPWVKRVTASELRSDLDRLRQIHRVRHVNGYGPWGENVRVKVRGLRSD